MDGRWAGLIVASGLIAMAPVAEAVANYYAFPLGAGVTYTGVPPCGGSGSTYEHKAWGGGSSGIAGIWATGAGPGGAVVIGQMHNKEAFRGWDKCGTAYTSAYVDSRYFTTGLSSSVPLQFSGKVSSPTAAAWAGTPNVNCQVNDVLGSIAVSIVGTTCSFTFTLPPGPVDYLVVFYDTTVSGPSVFATPPSSYQVRFQLDQTPVALNTNTYDDFMT